MFKRCITAVFTVLSTVGHYPEAFVVTLMCELFIYCFSNF